MASVEIPGEMSSSMAEGTEEGRGFLPRPFIMGLADFSPRLKSASQIFHVFSLSLSSFLSKKKQVLTHLIAMHTLIVHTDLRRYDRYVKLNLAEYR